MTISAHAPVPTGSRLIDADTVDLAAYRPRLTPAADHPFAGETPAEIGRRIWELNSTYTSPLSDREIARRLGINEADVNDAVTAYLAARPVDLLDGDEDRALWASIPAADVALLGEAVRINPAGVRQLGNAIRGGCPLWCTVGAHGRDEAKVDGFLIGQNHERIIVELTAADPAWTTRSATATVLVEANTEAGQVVTPPRVVLTVAEHDQGGYPGSEGVQGWTGSTHEARALAAALLAAAELVDGGAR